MFRGIEEMNKTNVENILNRYNSASEGNQAFYSLYKKAYELSAPNANNIDKTSHRGNLTQVGVLDSTMAKAADSFVNTSVTTICPPQTRWMELTPAKKSVNAIAEMLQQDPTDVQEELTELHQMNTDAFFDALNQSNFYTIVDQLFRDMFVGTSCLLIQPSNDLFNSASPLDFTAIPPLDIAVEVAPNQKITAVFRKTDVKYSDIKYIWPDFDLSVIRDNPVDKYASSKTFYEACLLEPKWVTTPSGEMVLKRWRYVVICDNKIGYEKYYRNNPFVVFFWNLLHGENVGRGLCLKAMPDALELEAMVDLKNRWMQMYALGVHTVQPSKMFNPATTKIRPNGVLLVKEQGAIQTLNPAGNPQAQQLEIEQLKQSIKQMSLDFNVPEDPRMTATQVNYIAQRQLQIFAGVVGRIQFQLLWPIVQNCLDILIESGDVILPQGLSQIDSTTTRLNILSPIGRVQNLNDINSLMTSLQYIGQIDPSLIPLHVKTEELPTWIFEQMGSPAKFLRSNEETQSMQMEMQQQAAANAMIQ